MNLDGLLKAAQKNTSVSVQKRCSLDIGPPKKLPKSKVDPNAIRALLQRKEKERREERDTLISKAVASTKRDDVHYKDHKGLRKQEQEWSEKCKRQWLKVQRERREFIQQMHLAADERDKKKQARDKDEVISSVKKKEEEKEQRKRKRKYETFEGTMDTSRKNKIRLSAPSGNTPKISDISELMRIAQSNAESGSFGANCTLPFEVPVTKKLDDEPRLLTGAEKRRIAEEQSILKKATEGQGIAKVPKIGATSNSGSVKGLNGIGRIPKKGESSSSVSANGRTTHREHSSSSSSKSSKSERSRSDREKERESKNHRERESSSSSSHRSKDSRDRAEREIKDKDRHKDQRKEHRDHKDSKDKAHKDQNKDLREKSHKGNKPQENGTSYTRQRLNGIGSTSKEARGRNDDRLAASSQQPVRKQLSHTSPISTMNAGSSASTVSGRVGISSGNVQLQSGDRERLRAEMARKLEQLQKERLANEAEERRKKLEARKARQMEEAMLKKRLRELQNSGPMDSDEEDDEEYDEDLDEYEDDFIDDADIDDPYAKRYSQDIAKIFKYDKRKYQAMDDEDIEESSFSRIMAEEARSARLGRQEDLEDMRREEEELRKKASKTRTLEELAKKLKQKKKLTLCPV
ncbi:hypothetical protein BIW11_11778 [Tropilaelaps mercedesae]|uniref:Protein SPT2 homolog n=1 Tax=Tropilaelaps mercedesae TaxID=418985 RepID=A0A1V9XA55_9ACAR|nr:hypothetical protein BIW11_11778 [Tropilaelaps mercedesae]